MPDVSVIIPTYNRQDYLQQAIDSCFAGNEEIDVEAVVVDDGSTDGTREFLEGLNDNRVRPLFQSNQGAQVARNVGQEAAHGRYIKHLDDDDYLRPGALARQAQVLDETDVPCCYGDCHVQFETPTLNYLRRRTMPSHRDLVVGATTGLHRWNLLFLFEQRLAKQATWDPDLDMLHIIAYLLEVARQDARCTKVDTSVAVHRIHREDRISNTHTMSDLSLHTTEFDLYAQFLRDTEVNGKQEEALLNKMWEKARIIADTDWSAFQECYREIKRQASTFQPTRKRPALRAVDRILGPVGTEALLYPMRKLKRFLDNQ
jgi:glycosyltransferase involved in cell wall biosynthesis